MAKRKDPKDKVNVFTLLKDLVGKDLTRVSMSVYLNEPISMLQRSCEIFEHTSVLDNANAQSDRFKRTAYCLGFLMMNLSQAIGRNKKPFNPLLGETFEVFHNGLFCICEQVSHHPPISALYAENDNFKVWGSFQPQSKFTFTKMLVTPKSTIMIQLKSTNEKFLIPYLPNSSVHNLIRGDIYVWHFGKCELLNLTTGDRAELNLKGHPLFGSLDYTYKGAVYDDEGKENNIR